MDTMDGEMKSFSSHPHIPLFGKDDNNNHIVSIADVLAHRVDFLQETELWALCRESILTLSKLLQNLPSYISPDNLMLCENGSVMFDILPHKAWSALYVAPEMQDNSKIASEKACIYSVGVTLQAAAGHVSGGSIMEVSPELESLILDMVDEDIDIRPTFYDTLVVCNYQEERQEVPSNAICQFMFQDTATALMEQEATTDTFSTESCLSKNNSGSLFGKLTKTQYDGISSESYPEYGKSISAFQPISEHKSIGCKRARSPHSSNLSLKCRYFSPVVIHSSDSTNDCNVKTKKQESVVKKLKDLHESLVNSAKKPDLLPRINQVSSVSLGSSEVSEVDSKPKSKDRAGNNVEFPSETSLAQNFKSLRGKSETEKIDKKAELKERNSPDYINLKNTVVNQCNIESLAEAVAHYLKSTCPSVHECKAVVHENRDDSSKVDSWAANDFSNTTFLLDDKKINDTPSQNISNLNSNNKYFTVSDKPMQFYLKQDSKTGLVELVPSHITSKLNTRDNFSFSSACNNECDYAQVPDIYSDESKVCSCENLNDLQPVATLGRLKTDQLFMSDVRHLHRMNKDSSYEISDDKTSQSNVRLPRVFHTLNEDTLFGIASNRREAMFDKTENNSSSSNEKPLCPCKLNMKKNCTCSPSPSKDSGISGVNTATYSSLMDRFLSSETVKRQQILKEIVNVIKDYCIRDVPSGFDIEEYSIGEYIMSLSGLKWETFTSAVTEKYANLHWTCPCLVKLYELSQTSMTDKEKESIHDRPHYHTGHRKVCRVTKNYPHFECQSQRPSLVVNQPISVSTSSLSDACHSDCRSEAVHCRSSHLNQKPTLPRCRSMSICYIHKCDDFEKTARDFSLPHDSFKKINKSKRYKSSRHCLEGINKNKKLYYCSSLSLASENLDHSALAPRDQKYNLSSQLNCEKSILKSDTTTRIPKSTSDSVIAETISLQHSRENEIKSSDESLYSELLDSDLINDKTQLHKPVRNNSIKPDVSIRSDIDTPREPNPSLTTVLPELENRHILCESNINVSSETREQFTKDFNMIMTGEDKCVAKMSLRNICTGDAFTSSSNSSSVYDTVDIDSEEEITSSGQTRCSNLVYHNAELQLTSTPDLKQFIKELDQQNQMNLEKKKKLIDQQIAMEVRLKKKAQMFFKRLLSSKSQKYDQRTLRYQVGLNIVEMTSKLQFLERAKCHIEMLILELYSLNTSLLSSLAKQSLDDVQSWDLEPNLNNPLLLFHIRHNPSSLVETKVLHAGLPSGLMSFLYASMSLVESYIHQFLFCFRYFSSSNDVLTFIVTRYKIARRQISSPQNTKIIRRSIDLIYFWLEGFYSIDFQHNSSAKAALQDFISKDLMDNEPDRRCLQDLLNKCQSGQNTELCFNGILSSDPCDVNPRDLQPFNHISKVLDSSLIPEWKSLKSLVGIKSPLLSRDKMKIHVASPITHKRESEQLEIYFPDSAKRSRTFSILDHSVQIIAEHLTLIEQELFQKTHPVQYLDSKCRGFGVKMTLHETTLSPTNKRKNSIDQPGKSDSLFIESLQDEDVISSIVQHDYHVTHWVAAEILSCPTSKIQLMILERFIHISHTCLRMRNYGTCMSIVAALESLVVRQLPIWKHLPAKYVQMMTEVAAVKVSLQNDSFYLTQQRNFRESPTIPSILIFILHVQRLEIGSFKLVNGMYKWAKMREISQLVDQIRMFKDHIFTYSMDLNIRDLLQHRIRYFVDHDLHTIAVQNHTNYQKLSGRSLHGIIHKVTHRLALKHDRQ